MSVAGQGSSAYLSSFFKQVRQSEPHAQDVGELLSLGIELYIDRLLRNSEIPKSLKSLASGSGLGLRV